MASSRLAQHLPSLFGPSRRAAWRLSVVRRALSATAILLALHVGLEAVRPTASGAPAPPRDEGTAISLPLAAPADHLAAGDAVSVYLPGRTEPLVREATVLGVPGEADSPVVRITLPASRVPPVLREMGPDRGLSTGFVLVRAG